MEAAKKAMEAVDLEMLRVRHRREEEEAEEEDDRRSSLSSGNDRVGNWVDSTTGQNNASPPLSPRLSPIVRSPANSVQSSISLATRSETSVTADGTKVKPTPKPRRLLSRRDSNGIATGLQRDRNGNDQVSAPSRAASDDDDDCGFSPVAPRKGSSKSKTT